VLGRLVLVVPVAAVVLAGIGGEAEARQCCFANPGFTGTCQVTVEKGEQCSAVLDYLNTPNTSGRSYCNSSEIRGGWTSVACPTSDQGGATATPTKPRTSMINERLPKSRRTPSPTADGAANTPAPTPTAGK
jgi:hypothetical protein